jgi:CHASE2 domain-containing sensor protein
MTAKSVRSQPSPTFSPLAVALAAIIAVVSTGFLAVLLPRYAPGLLRFEHALADLRTSLFSDQRPSQHPGVAVVFITDETLKDHKTLLPVDRALLAKLVDAVDAAGARAIGLDFLFYRTAPVDNEETLIDSLRRARAKIVLAAADERLNLNEQQVARQAAFIAATGRPAGYVNLAVERDWVVRFKAKPAGPNPAFPKSFAGLLAESAGAPPAEPRGRIAWLKEPEDGTEAFLRVPAETLLGPADAPAAQFAREGLKDKVVIIGGLFADMDQHLTPLSALSNEKMPGAVIHAHMVAEQLDGRRVRQFEVDTFAARLELAALAAVGFLVGWRYHMKRQGLLTGSLATVTIVAFDTIVFWGLRIVLPFVLALMAWFIGEWTGHYTGVLLDLWSGTRRKVLG